MNVLMCRPRCFSALNYVINPWMKPGTINHALAVTQWENLVETYQKLGVMVSIIDQEKNLPDMVFATDNGFVVGNKVLISRFRYKERQGETAFYKQWFSDHGYTIIETPKELFFEGNGTMSLMNKKLFVGVGYRTDEKMCRYLQRIFPYEVISITATDPAFYHLDICFLPVNETTAFYYPQAYTKKSREVLIKYVPNLIPLTKKETEGFCANSVVVGKTIVHQAGNDTFVKKIKKIGYVSCEVDVSEFKKSGGGIHCLTNILNA